MGPGLREAHSRGKLDGSRTNGSERPGKPARDTAEQNAVRAAGLATREVGAARASPDLGGEGATTPASSAGEEKSTPRA